MKEGKSESYYDNIFNYMKTGKYPAHLDPNKKRAIRKSSRQFKIDNDGECNLIRFLCHDLGLLTTYIQQFN